MTQIVQGAQSINLAFSHSGPQDGPTILLLHAGGENRTVWDPIIDRLHKLPWKIIAPDLRGHGESERADHYKFADFVEDIEKVIAELAGTPLLVVGGSIGGLIGFMLAGQSNSPVSGLISLDVTPQPPTKAGMQERAKITSAISRNVPQVSSVDPKMASGSLVQEILANSSAIRAKARNITAPVWLIQAQKSNAVGEIERQTFLEDVPHAEVISVDCGHLVARDQPDLVANTIMNFISANGEWRQGS